MKTSSQLGLMLVLIIIMACGQVEGEGEIVFEPEYNKKKNIVL